MSQTHQENKIYQILVNRFQKKFSIQFVKTLQVFLPQPSLPMRGVYMSVLLRNQVNTILHHIVPKSLHIQ